MKIIAIIVWSCLVTLPVFGQDITGSWNGLLKVQGMQLRLVFNITQTDTGLSATMDSPDQGAKGIPVTTVSFENKTLKLGIASARIEYEGMLGQDNIIAGNFMQAGQSFPLDLTKEIVEKEIISRPQEPVKPYPYYEEEVSFKNEKAGHSLSGTLTLPKKDGVYPAVILITGSGPQNRDEELLGHKPFLVLSDYLTRNGIAVLRFDDRGIGASTGDFKTATSADFANDVEAGVAYLLTRKELDKKKIGLIGHSEGGIIAPMVAARNKNVSFIVLMAGTGIPGDQLLLLQSTLIGRAAGVSEEDLLKTKNINKGAYDLVIKSKNTEELNRDLTAYMTAYIEQVLKEDPAQTLPEGTTIEEVVKVQVDGLISPWMQYFIKYNPALILEKVKCPVLAINGERDLQVPPKENLDAIKTALAKGGNKKVTTVELPGLNHLFQECTTGSPDEYATIEQTISPVALTTMLEWMQLLWR